MNKTKKKRFKMTILVVCLIGVIIASQVMKAMATSTGQVTTTVSNFSQLYSAMIQAKDGDVIGINASITLSGTSKVGYPDKHIILKRMNSSTYFNVGSEATFENITFDGGGISASSAYIIANGKMTFKNVTFKNCMNSNSGGGGAVHIINNTADFYNCTFEDNIAVEGSHIYVNNSGNVTIESSTLKNGHAITYGGAIMNGMNTGTINITSSIITGNSAERLGGGIFNRGYMKITGTKIFDNTAPNGADIANVAYGNLNLADSIETLVELFKDDKIIPKAWVNDYDGSTDLSSESINPTAPNSLYKLDYEIVPTEVTLSPSSLGTASDGKIIGLESGKYYKITSDEVVSYSKADGSLTATESKASPLLGTEIIGLNNGETYLVEEFTPAPTTVIVDSTSLGTADNGKITGLTAGKMYKVSVDGTTNYTKADGTLTTNEAEAGKLIGTEIIGLTNGKDYLVEEYTPVEPEPTEKPTDPVDETPTDQGTGSTTNTSNNTTTTTNTTSTNNSNNASTTTNATTDNSTTNNSTSNVNNSDSSSTVNNNDSSSTVNNYSYDYSNHTKTENRVIPSNDSKNSRNGQATATKEQTIKIDYGNALNKAVKVQEDGKDITININVNVNDKVKDKEKAEGSEAVQASRTVTGIQPENNLTWIEVIKICLLFGILVCLIKRPSTK